MVDFFFASPRQICKRIHYHYLKQLPEVTKPVNLTEVPLPSWQYPLHTHTHTHTHTEPSPLQKTLHYGPNCGSELCSVLSER